MPEKQWTPEEISAAIDEMVDADISEQDIDQFLVGIGAQPRNQAMFFEKPAGEQALEATRQLALFAGPAVGGLYGAQTAAGRNVLPFLGGIGRAITQFGGETAGIAAGDVAGRLAANVPQDPMETGELALKGGALGSAFRGAVQLGGMVGNVPEQALIEAAEPVKARMLGRNVPLPVPNVKRVMRAGPHTPAQVKAGMSPEAELTERASRASQKLSGTITEARKAKEAIINQATQQGTRLPAKPIFDALVDSQIGADVAISAEAQAYNLAVEETADALLNIAAKQGGTLKPTQVDEMIRRVLRPKVYTASGNVRDTMLAEAYGNAEAAATKVLTENLPGNLAAKNAEIAERLTKLENAHRMFGDPDKAGVTGRLSSAFNKGNEQTTQALNTLAQHDAKLVDDAYDLYVRRQFAGDIRSAGGEAGYFGTIIRKPAELATRGAAPFQRFVGGARAGQKEYKKHADPKVSDVVKRMMKRARTAEANP